MVVRRLGKAGHVHPVSLRPLSVGSVQRSVKNDRAYPSTDTIRMQGGGLMMILDVR
jgi:hypothetical protein